MSMLHLLLVTERVTLGKSLSSVNSIFLICEMGYINVRSTVRPLVDIISRCAQQHIPKVIPQGVTCSQQRAQLAILQNPPDSLKALTPHPFPRGPVVGRLGLIGKERRKVGWDRVVPPIGTGVPKRSFFLAN
jgi:hypothetical protein